MIHNVLIYAVFCLHILTGSLNTCCWNKVVFYGCIFYFPWYYVFLGAIFSSCGPSKNVTTGLCCISGQGWVGRTVWHMWMHISRLSCKKNEKKGSLNPPFAENGACYVRFCRKKLAASRSFGLITTKFRCHSFIFLYSVASPVQDTTCLVWDMQDVQGHLALTQKYWTRPVILFFLASCGIPRTVAASKLPKLSWKKRGCLCLNVLCSRKIPCALDRKVMPTLFLFLSAAVPFQWECTAGFMNLLGKRLGSIDSQVPLVTISLL